MRMKKFKITVIETLEKTIEVEADDKADAQRKALQMYKDEEIVLTSDDYVDYEIAVEED
jgi:hypothetical protein